MRLLKAILIFLGVSFAVVLVMDVVITKPTTVAPTTTVTTTTFPPEPTTSVVTTTLAEPPPPDTGSLLRELLRATTATVEPTFSVTYNDATYRPLDQSLGEASGYIPTSPVRLENFCLVLVNMELVRQFVDLQPSGVGQFVDLRPDAYEANGFRPDGSQIPGFDYVVEGRDNPSYFQEVVTLPADPDFLIFSIPCGENVDSIGLYTYIVDLESGTYTGTAYMVPVADIPQAPPALADELAQLEPDIVNGVVSVVCRPVGCLPSPPPASD